MTENSMRYQVFISSVSRELKEERKEIIEKLLLKKRYFPVAMEYFTAGSNSVRTIYEYIKQSDIYVLILRKEKGSEIGENGRISLDKLCGEDNALKEQTLNFCEKKNISAAEITFTQMEYIMACSRGLEILAFIYNDEDLLEASIADFGINPIHTAMAWTTSKDLTDKVISSLDSLQLPDYLGWFRKVDSSLHQTARDEGIADIAYDGRGFQEKLAQQVENTKEMLLFYTTGKGFVHGNLKLLASFVSRGGSLKLICGLPGSDFLTDIGTVETMKMGFRADIHGEFWDVMGNLRTIYSYAKTEWENRGKDTPFGTIELAGARTLFRSSIILCIKDDGDAWGWLAVTLPPEKSVDMISLELQGNITGSNTTTGLLTSSESHFRYVWELADKENLIIKVSDDIDLEEVKRQISPRAYWENKWSEAEANMKRRKRMKKVLIEVAAQHPLKDGCEPDIEFAARLDYAYNLYLQKKEEGLEVELFVPGSVHLDYDGVADDCSLSEAGVEYLLDKGVPESDIHGDDLNNATYEGRLIEGVYNTADECFIASQYFLREDSGFGALYSVCSPNQVPRKTFFYVENGLIPQVCSVPTKKMFHNFLGEMFESIPYIINEDHDWQSPESREAVRTRKERMPGWKGNK